MPARREKKVEQRSFFDDGNTANGSRWETAHLRIRSDVNARTQILQLAVKDEPVPVDILNREIQPNRPQLPVRELRIQWTMETAVNSKNKSSEQVGAYSHIALLSTNLILIRHIRFADGNSSQRKLDLLQYQHRSSA